LAPWRSSRPRSPAWRTPSASTSRFKSLFWESFNLPPVSMPGAADMVL
jgi:hypothetical protein